MRPKLHYRIEGAEAETEMEICGVSCIFPRGWAIICHFQKKVSGRDLGAAQPHCQEKSGFKNRLVAL